MKMKTLRSEGLTLKVDPLGLTLKSLVVEFQDGPQEVLVQPKDPVYCAGALVGRYANRIKHGEFMLRGSKIALHKGNAAHCLHGGVHGFNQRVFTPTKVTRNEANFKLWSLDGDQGFPGDLEVNCTVRLEGNTMYLIYSATTSKTTVVNLTHHPYFNLGDTQDIYNHALRVDCIGYLPVTDNLIPTGEIRNVQDTPFDFQNETLLKDRVHHPVLKETGGFDHCLLLRGKRCIKLSTGLTRSMEIRTSEPGVQIFTAQCLEGKVDTSGRVFTKHPAICLETQHFPDSPNHLHFPSTVLEPGQVFQSWTSFTFKG